MEKFSTPEKTIPRAFKKGEVVFLKKISLNEGEKSDVESGAVLYGSLTGNVRIGDSARLSDGSQTSTIQNIYEKDGRTFLETRTSTYEISPNEISDLNTENELGSIHLPPDAKLAELNQEPLDQQFRTPDQKVFEFYINQKALEGVLLEIDGGQLFRVMQGRFVVVCKVGNIHVPFYLSSSGESGKKMNEWYPFFGGAVSWIVKGNVNKETGEMYYHDEISKVQKLLSEHLRFPESKYISPRGKFGSGAKAGGVEPETVFVDLGEHLKYKNIMFTEWKNGRENEYVKRITGYDPKNVVYGDDKDSGHRWIDGVVKSIK